MLVLTPAAVTVVNELTEGHEKTQEAGLRISTTEEPAAEGGLQVEVAPSPTPGDQVLGASGARVFLEDAAASYLNDMVLDAEVDEAGSAHFRMSPQQPGETSPA